MDKTLAERIEALPDDWQTGFDKDSKITATDLKALLTRAVEAEAKVAEWIPVSERLPPTDDLEYLATYERDGYIGVAEMEYFGNDGDCSVVGGWWDAVFEFDRVIAWMPLPNPYAPKGESDE